MFRHIILSGNVGAGKSTLAKSLTERFSAVRVRTHEILNRLGPNVPQTRKALQEFGEQLDRETQGRWVCDGLTEAVQKNEKALLFIVDSIRIASQVEAIRDAYGQRVIHVHLTADVTELARRYASRKDSGVAELSSYIQVRENQTEGQVDELAKIADIVIQTDRCLPPDVLARVASSLGLYGHSDVPWVDVIVGGAYGSEGKGQLAAYLAPEYDLLVRVGGPNAGHSVFEEDTPYVFHHLPSGSRCSSAKIMLGPGAALYVPGLMKEIADCKLSAERLVIDPQAMIITDEDRQAEGRLKETIGSTGQGVGMAMARRIRDRGQDSVKLAKDIAELKPFIRDTHEVLEDTYRRQERILLEGTQGTALSLYHGSYPHVTSRDTTAAGCLAEAGISPRRVRKIILVCRTYPIRVEDPEKTGATSGDMSQPIDWDIVAKRSGHSEEDLRRIERTSTTGRRRRVGEFDWGLLRKSVSLNAPTDIALTFVDYINKDNENARRFDQLNNETIRFVEEIEKVSEAPVSLISTRFHSRGIIDRRNWQHGFFGTQHRD